MKQILKTLSNSYFAIILVALAAGLIIPGIKELGNISTLLLGAIFFLGALKINLKEAVKYLKAIKMLLVVNIFMLILFPVAAYAITLLIIPELALALLLLAAMPSGMTDPLLSEISGGGQGLALILTISTSLLAPFTIPLVLQLAAGTEIAVSFLDMSLALMKVIFIPFILAEIIKHIWDKSVKRWTPTIKPISIILLALLIAGIVAKQKAPILEALSGEKSILYLAALFIFFILLHFIGYFTIFWRNKKDRITVTVCLTYMNFTLAIYLADKFFDEPNIIIPVILAVLPWSLLLFPFSKIMKRVR